jgi:hypothetical protein
MLLSGLSAQEKTHYDLVSRGPCPYSGRDWEIKYETPGPRRDTVCVPLFKFGERVPSRYDTPKLREALVPFVHQCAPCWFYHREFRAIDLTSYNLALRAEYEFPSDTDLVLLKYEVYPSYSYLFVAYLKSSGKMYPLADDYAAPVDSQFNRLLADNPALLSLSPVCRASLLVSLKYGGRGIWVLDSIIDLMAAEAIGFARPLDGSLSFHELFVFAPSRDSVLMSFFNWWEYRWMDESFSMLHRSHYEDSLTIEEPLVQTGQSVDTVSLTVCDRYYGELARWMVVFAKDGTVHFLDYVGKPIFTYAGVESWPRHSPYYRTRKWESE